MNYPPPQGGGFAPPSPYGQAPSPYGVAPNAYGAPPMPGAPIGYAAPPMIAANPNAKSTGLAIALELLGGFFFQTFGIGNMYAGNVGLGIGLMLGYWVLTAINVALCFLFIGLITWPLTWLLFAILCPILANNTAKKTNARMMGQPF